MTENTHVVIIGAGPAGLALSLALAQHRIQNIVLEKEVEVNEDPRGVFLTGDALRIFQDLGIGPDFPNIGHEVEIIKFHQEDFHREPFYTMQVGDSNAYQHELPYGLMQMQPRMEAALRRQVEASPYCSLRTGCEVVAREAREPPVVEYVDRQGGRHRVGAQWLVGADGKKGIVRKRWLEPEAGIHQVPGVYPYEGTWVAANLRIRLPTPQSHPDFPLWDLGYAPEAVYDLFWPAGWHFCAPPGKPTASGRFGPPGERLWRHEFREEEQDATSGEQALALLWERLTPQVTLGADAGRGVRFPRPVAFPRDCVQVLRCASFTFTHRMVNRWFHGRTLLIGDAAHVFPPFAGQGIASGVRDAHQLAWRLALLLRRTAGVDDEENDAARRSLAESLLATWAAERRHSVDDVARLSRINGDMCNEAPTALVRGAVWLERCLRASPWLPNPPDPQAKIESDGFTRVQGGFLLSQCRGGARLAQIYVCSTLDKTPRLSDCFLRRTSGLFTLVVITTPDGVGSDVHDARCAIEASQIDKSLLCADGVVPFIPRAFEPHDEKNTTPEEIFYTVSASDPQERVRASGRIAAYITRLGGQSTKFALVRPDFFTYACAGDRGELEECLTALKTAIACGAE